MFGEWWFDCNVAVEWRGRHHISYFELWSMAVFGMAEVAEEFVSAWKEVVNDLSAAELMELILVPTAAGDFLFTGSDLDMLLTAFEKVRLNVFIMRQKRFRSFKFAGQFAAVISALCKRPRAEFILIEFLALQRQQIGRVLCLCHLRRGHTCCTDYFTCLVWVPNRHLLPSTYVL